MYVAQERLQHCDRDMAGRWRTPIVQSTAATATPSFQTPTRDRTTTFSTAPKILERITACASAGADFMSWRYGLAVMRLGTEIAAH